MKLNTSRFTQNIKVSAIVIGIFCVIELLNILVGRSLNQYGLVPRELFGLVGIITAPFLHINISHFLSNVMTLWVFIYLCLQFGRMRFFLLSAHIIIVSGILLWIFGRAGYHVGASGLLYGYFGYLLLAGWLSNSFLLLSISIGIAILYGSVIWGVLPQQEGVSWEGHLFGWFNGLAFAWITRKQWLKKQRKETN